MENNILCNLLHFPLLVTEIFAYSLKRPFILHHMIQNSNYLKDKMKNVRVEKFKKLPKEINKLFSFFDEISHFQENYKNLMTKEIKIEEEEKNFYITKPYINSLFDISDKLFFFYKSFLSNDKDKNLFAKNLFEFCLCQHYITLSINLFSKDNDINTINMELTDADLDYNYIKYLNQTQNLNQIKNQKIKLCINIYNKYSRIKRNEFSKIVYYNNINIYKYLSNIFNKNNGQLGEKITRIEIIYNCEDINLFFKNIQILQNNSQKEELNNCYLPNLKELIIKNDSNKVYQGNITNKNTKNKYYNFLSFLCSFSKCLSSIIIQDSYIPFNIFDFKNININNITQLNIKSPSLNNYSYSEIIERINNFKNLEFISIDTLSQKFNDSFKDARISKNLENVKEFKFNDFFEYRFFKGHKIIFKQNCSISEDLFFMFSEIVENKKNLEKIELNGFPYNLEKIKNQSVRNIEINLEEDDRNYIIKKIKYKNINLKLQNFPNLNSLYIYVDILESVENFIELPINPNLKRIFLFSSYINCDVNVLDSLLKKNGVELILRIIDSYNKGMIMAYIASFPSIN